MVGRLKYRLFMVVFDCHEMAAQTLWLSMLYVQLYGMRNIYGLWHMNFTLSSQSFISPFVYKAAM